jgi:hypothetical protein
MYGVLLAMNARIRNAGIVHCGCDSPNWLDPPRNANQPQTVSATVGLRYLQITAPLTTSYIRVS